MIRTILAVIAVIIFFLCSVITVPIILIIGIFDKYKRDMAALRCVQFIFRIVLFIAGTKIIVEGRENIFKDKTAFYTLNHRGFFDVLLTYIYMTRPAGFVSKIEIRKVPFLNFWMVLVHCIFLDRKDTKSSMRTIVDMIKHVKDGYSVCICPEGTRNRTQENLLPFKSGSFQIALKTGAPVVPVAIYNTNAVLEDHFPRIKSSKVYIGFLDPIDTSKMNKNAKEELSAQVYSLIYQRIEYAKKKFF